MWRTNVIQGKTYPAMDSSIHGKRDGASFYSVSRYVHKLQHVLVIACNLFTILAVQIDLSVIVIL